MIQSAQLQKQKMVGASAINLYDVISEIELRHILNQAVGFEWQMVEYNMRPAAEGLTGFLGDHYKVTLDLKREEQVKKLHLFLKNMPQSNEVKARYIEEGDFYRREMKMFQMFDKLGGDDGATPWHAKAYLHNDRIIVMPDLTVQGYAPQPYNETLDLAHILVVAASIARFHAAFANYAAKQTSNGKQFNILHDCGESLSEPTFMDSPFIHTAAKCSTNLLKNFSDKYKHVPDLDENITRLYLEACNSLKDYPGTLNVLLHKDLWANNIMFRHEGGVPVSAVLVDFQCVRYGPPAFDVSMLLHLTTSRSFREQHERCILQHYFSYFSNSLHDCAKMNLKVLGYDFCELLCWFEKSRMFGMVCALAIFPFVLMDPVSAACTFNDPDTFVGYINEDRSQPVLEYCRRNSNYKQRMLELTQEFVERYFVESINSDVM